MASVEVGVGTRHNGLGNVLRDLGDLPGTRMHLERALRITQTTLGPNHPSLAALHNNLGLVLSRLADLGAARGEYERALEITQATLGSDHPNAVIIHANLDYVLQHPGGE